MVHYKTKKLILCSILLLFCSVFSYSQDSTTTKKVYEHFRDTRIINLQSIESLSHGILELKISHRFGALSGGANELWGLDQATMRMAFEYGLTSRIMLGIGRSTNNKMFDGFIKANLLEQYENGTPISLSLFSSINVNGVPFDDSRTNFFSSRLSYVSQVILASKISDDLTIQLSPTVIHKNLVELEEDKNLSYALGVAGKYNLTKVLSLNAEYIYRLQNGVNTPSFEDNYNSLSVGLGIHTKGHFFELHLTNSTPMYESGYILETSDSWLDGKIHFGFNIVRDFKLTKPKK